MNFEEPPELGDHGNGQSVNDFQYAAADSSVVAHPPEDPFIEYLKTLRGRKIYLKPYWGNAGDELIWLGTDLIFKQLGLDRVLNPQTADVILWPGGNPTMWQTNLTGWQDAWRRWPHAEFVVGPAGFQGSNLPWRELLKKTPAKIGGLFARDPVSYENLHRLGMPPTVKIGLSHDPAFYLRDSKWVADLREACSSEYILASFRGDHESSMRRAEPGLRFRVWPVLSLYDYRNRRRKNRHYRERFDLVRELAGSNLPIHKQDASEMSFNAFVECVSRASQVHTDRLHCMIFALLLGKTVFAYSTSYSKLEDIYQHSVKPWAKVTVIPSQSEKQRARSDTKSDIRA